MNMNEEHKDCYGSMFPDTLHLNDNVANTGQVFTVRVEKPEGGVLPVCTSRSIEVDIDQWKVCQLCADYESCYKLSLAKIALESAIACH